MLLTTLLLCTLGASPVPAEFDALFTGATLRFDYHHVGDATHEQIAPDVLRVEGPWPGSRNGLVDDTNLGKYLFEILDPETGAVLYSRGFASIYGEWETTGEAKRQWRSIHESVRFPEPREPFSLVLKKRGPDGAFGELFTQVMDPHTHFVDRSALPSTGQLVTIVENGPPANKVDLLVLGEGYTADQGAKFEADLTRLAGEFLEFEPFKSRAADFNIRGLHVPSEEAGISNPRLGVWRASPLGLSFNAFDSDRYVLTFANRSLREAAAQAPYDALILLFNDRKYGGGGILKLYATVASDNAFTPYVLVHEFGHHFAGLADEYYTSDVAYESTTARPEPWEPNATASGDSPKWRHLVTPGVPLPTPWAKEAFETAQKEIQGRRREIRAEGRPEEEMEALFHEEQRRVEALLGEGPHADAVGAFEGANYESRGYFRPQANCMMFTRAADFCAVCRQAIERVIDLYSRPAQVAE